MVVAELFAALGLHVDEVAFRTAEASIHKLELGLFGVVAAAGTAALGLSKIVESTAEAGLEASKSAERVGISTDSWQELGYAAKRSGVDAEGLQHALIHLSRAAYEASTGSTDLRYAFGQLGVSVYGSNGKLKLADELFSDVSEAFHKMPAGPQKAALAMQLFSRSGAELIPLLNKGRVELERLRAEAHDFGLVLDNEAIANSKAFIGTQKDMSNALRGLAYAIGAKLLPGAGQLAQKFALWVKANREVVATKITDFVKTLIAAVKKLGDVAAFLLRNLWAVEAVLGFLAAVQLAKGAIAFAAYAAEMIAAGEASLIFGERSLLAGAMAALAAVAPILAWAAFAAALYLILDDIDAFLKGEDSLIGKYGARWTHFLDDFLQDRSDDFWLTSALKAALRAITDVQGAWDKLQGALTAKAAEKGLGGLLASNTQHELQPASLLTTPIEGVSGMLGRIAGQSLGQYFGGGSSPTAQAAAQNGQAPAQVNTFSPVIQMPQGTTPEEAHKAARDSWNDWMDGLMQDAHAAVGP
jgi:hypothetical protein